MSDRHQGPPPKFEGHVLGRAQLDMVADGFRCKCPECKGKIPCMFVNPSCCKASVDATYIAGRLELRCHKCKRPIFAVKVAET